MNSNFGYNAKAPLWLGPVVSSLLVGLGSLNEEVLLQKPEPGVVGDEPCRSGDHPESLENFT